MGVTHFHRLLKIFMLLQTRRSYSVAGLAAELGVSQRTVHRDLKALTAAGMPYHYDREAKALALNSDVLLQPLQLTLGETMALSALASQLAKQGQIPFVAEAWRAMIKIESQLPAALRDQLSASSENLFIQAARSSPQDGSADHFHTLSKAIADRRKVRCIYDGGADGDSGQAFLFRPYALLFGQRAWYTIGFSEHRGEERCLKLNRIKQCISTDRPYMIPDGWTLDSHLGLAWRMIRGERRYHVAIRFVGEFARTVAETLWHATQKITWQEDGSCLFECDVDGLSEIVWWVLGYGPNAEVLEPLQLRQIILQLAQATNHLYNEAKPQRKATDRFDAHRLTMT